MMMCENLFKERKIIVTDEMVEKFAEVSGDFNPVHFDDKLAQKAHFKQRIAHGMLSASFISGVLGSSDIGRGGIYMKQILEFLRPVYIGDEITVKAQIKELRSEKKTATIETLVLNSLGKTVIRGEAVVWSPQFTS